ncbi:MAG TPA: kelch repeat-containing protein, partial [Blastocatellia bacterium]|nr:kelch repeat-containing protein [Blastocatellia bacterium]
MKAIRLILTVLLLTASAIEVYSRQSAWSQTGSLGTGRFIPSAVLLADGKVLVVGGTSCAGPPLVCQAINSPEIYDPATGTWTATGNMLTPRTNHFAVRLANGKVLVGGGFSQTKLSSAELYDPETGSWTPTGSLITARTNATATLLANGKVLVAGGEGPENGSTSLDSAEIYDPDTGRWSPTGTMNAARNVHTATLLENGKVLIASGVSGPFASPTLLNSAELYDPDAGSWTLTGSLGTARPFHTATRLANGKVLAVGGSNFTSVIYDTAELYDPATGLWSSTGRLIAPRISHTATLLANGKVLVAAGSDAREKRAELYDPATDSWSLTDDLNVARLNHAAALLEDGRVLVVGGNPG